MVQVALVHIMMRADRSERHDAASGPGPRETDPRRFRYRITCEWCGEFRHTPQAMRWHLMGCPSVRGEEA